MNTAFVLGNGTSRQHFDLEKMRGKGIIYACNAVYRNFEPDVLIAVDPKMVHEIVADGYHHNHVVWTNYNNGYKDLARSPNPNSPIFFPESKDE